jgi:hypothetical protein
MFKPFKKILFSLLLVISISGCNNEKGVNQSTNASGLTEESSLKTIGIGQVLKTEYFDVVANKVSIQEKVKTGNIYSDLKKTADNLYLVINATFTNTSQESRMLFDGSVWIEHNGKQYQFDHSETVLAEGFGLLLDEINPMLSKTTNLVYRIPKTIQGSTLYWQPGRANNDEVILLGDFNYLSWK